MKEKSDGKSPGAHTFYLGTYTGKESQGIYKYLLKSDGTIEEAGLPARSNNPSFLTRSSDGKFLLAISEIRNEDDMGFVESYMVEKDTLILKSRTSSGGAHPCHVSINSEGYILMSNYSGGNVGLVQLDESGKLSDLLDVKQHSGSGTTDRQKGPHAHSALFIPGSMRVVAADLGTNELWLYNVDSASGKFDTGEEARIPMSPGAGPRHFVFHPEMDLIYVVNELDCTITIVERTEQGDYQAAVSYSTLPEGYEEASFCADIHLSPDGRFLYASNRGHNSIVMFRVDQSDGSLEFMGTESTRGDWPRNFAISPTGEYLLVANQKSNNLVSFRRNGETGTLEYVSEAEAPTPTCVLFW